MKKQIISSLPPQRNIQNKSAIPEKVGQIILDLQLCPGAKPAWTPPNGDALGTWHHARNILWPCGTGLFIGWFGHFITDSCIASRSCQLWSFPNCLRTCCSASDLFLVHPSSVSGDHSPLAYLPSLISEGRCFSKQIAFVILTSSEKLSRVWPVLDPAPKCGYILSFAPGHPVLTVDKKHQ